MFTGLIEGVGRVARLTPVGPDLRLTVAPPWPLAEAVLGESVAINGACLTVTGTSSQGFNLDVSAESLDKTGLGALKPGSQVNLERAMKLGDRLGGHLVTGHVDCQGRITAITPVGGSRRVEISIPPEHLKLVVAKGSVAVNGISLTVNEVSETAFSLNIIPHTWEATTLKLARQGDSVNIETDLIGKYVARLVNRESAPGGGGGLTREGLARLGF